MPDAVFVGLLGIAGNILASLNSSNPQNDFEALKVIDENDPIRLSLTALQDGGNIKPGTCLMLTDGAILGLRNVFEVGHGAARLLVGAAPHNTFAESRLDDFTFDKQWTDPLSWFNAVIRYQAIRGILEPRPRR